MKIEFANILLFYNNYFAKDNKINISEIIEIL
jgi:hypothetical protein